MKRYKVEAQIEGQNREIELNASSIAVAIRAGAEQLTNKKREITGKPVKSLTVTATELYAVKKEYYVTTERQEHTELGTFPDYQSARIASAHLDREPLYSIRDRYVRKGG